MPEKRNTQTYDLMDGNKVVYRGTTNDPQRREQEHRDEGKNFSRLKPTSRKMTEKGAKLKEAKDLERYRGNHGGKNPKHNKATSG